MQVFAGYRVDYQMQDKTRHQVRFETMPEVLGFKGSCNTFIRKGIITSFNIIKLVKDNSGIQVI